MDQQPDLVCVATCQGILLGELFKSKLEASGVPVLLQYESAGLVFGITVDGLGEVRILVPASLAEQAREALKELPPQDACEE